MRAVCQCTRESQTIVYRLDGERGVRQKTITSPGIALRVSSPDIPAT